MSHCAVVFEGNETIEDLKKKSLFWAHLYDALQDYPGPILKFAMAVKPGFRCECISASTIFVVLNNFQSDDILNVMPGESNFIFGPSKEHLYEVGDINSRQYQINSHFPLSDFGTSTRYYPLTGKNDSDKLMAWRLYEMYQQIERTRKAKKYKRGYTFYKFQEFLRKSYPNACFNQYIWSRPPFKPAFDKPNLQPPLPAIEQLSLF